MTTKIYENHPYQLPQVVADLRKSREETHKIRHLGRVRELPSRHALEEILGGIFASLFPTHYGRSDLTDESIDYFVGNALGIALNQLSEQIRRGLYFSSSNDLEQEAKFDALAHDLTSQFAAELSSIRALIVSDIRAALSGDPAATSVSEILLCYPGVSAAIHYRIAHALYKLGSPLLARFISEIAHSKTGVDIHPGAQIGEGFFIDHGTGVVIGQTAILGKNIRLYQAVTLGAKRFPEDDDGNLIKGAERHPILEDDVVIYAGATVLGRITIGARSTIGGNVWLTKSVTSDSNISQAQTLGH
ncbi:serine O-acetyltransferase EpsC [Polynucleobacter sp. AM-25C3]|uniref:serine O-acetyltransferase EpsC n=1 Tax=Polynucleobacter sp. AM-25C3 TaxID=1855569 RepID=UPI001C0D0969|nr:serine O-acetyltransferase EpsC [Polynucleobacter sp. AM-25C3]MBU3601873.1 serine acetyltransferase [Polynucleobacter sp. AM-25C3]